MSLNCLEFREYFRSCLIYTPNLPSLVNAVVLTDIFRAWHGKE